MRRKWLLLILGAAILLPVACILYVIHEPPKVFKLYQIETIRGGGMSWDDGPDVELSLANAAKINQEIASLLEKESPNQHYQFIVIPTGKRSVKYRDVLNMPDSLYKKLSDYAGKRVSELAEEQAVEQKSETAK